MIEDLEQRLERMECALAELIRQNEQLLRQHWTQKDAYSTAEAGTILGRAEYTVREWLRHGQVRGQKRLTGRGRSKEWIIPHAELMRVQREGPSPLGTFWEQKGPRKAPAG